MRKGADQRGLPGVHAVADVFERFVIRSLNLLEKSCSECRD
jgi:hypothetical protein